jgi:pyruvate/2-oxoglutarate dehydrogenase complex dihydrolipoamide acyltransferase (E2) component
MPASIGSERWVEVGTNSAGDKMYARNLSAGVQGAEEPRATEEAMALAAEHGIDLASVQGSGKNGKVLKGDVEALIGD